VDFDQTSTRKIILFVFLTQYLYTSISSQRSAMELTMLEEFQLNMDERVGDIE